MCYCFRRRSRRAVPPPGHIHVTNRSSVGCFFKCEKFARPRVNYFLSRILPPAVWKRGRRMRRRSLASRAASLMSTVCNNKKKKNGNKGLLLHVQTGRRVGDFVCMFNWLQVYLNWWGVRWGAWGWYACHYRLFSTKDLLTSFGFIIDRKLGISVEQI